MTQPAEDPSKNLTHVDSLVSNDSEKSEKSPTSSLREIRVQPQSCLHCDQPVPHHRHDAYCCTGCRWVYTLLHQKGLTQYYDLRPAGFLAASEASEKKQVSPWMEELIQVLNQNLETSNPSNTRFSFDIQNLQCTACVWLVEALFRQKSGAKNIRINPALGRVEMLITADFPLQEWMLEVESFGYKLGPSTKKQAAQNKDLIFRMGICIALAANVMLFSIAKYVGLSSGPVYIFFGQVSYAASLLSVIIGGSVFIRAAYRGIRKKIIHLDLPIALGIVLAFVGSSVSYFTQTADALYLDTVSVFIALMLVGRVLQTRLVDANQNRIHTSTNFEKIQVRIIVNERVEIVSCAQIKAKDILLIAPGDLVPVDATLLDKKGVFSFDWIDGESTPRGLNQNEKISAGAFNAGKSACRVQSNTHAEATSLLSLLHPNHENLEKQPKQHKDVWWAQISILYTVFVLTAAFIGGAYWLWFAKSPIKALEVTVAILVVTCPCAFGIAVPLAHELVYSFLRKQGLFVRSSSFFDRALRIRKIVFDKTGTLTTGVLSVANPESLQSLSVESTKVLYNMVTRSNHPKSAALQTMMEEINPPVLFPSFAPTFTTEEHLGKGIEYQNKEDVYRLGNPSWAIQIDHIVDDEALCFSKNGIPLAAFLLEEQLRAAAKEEINTLRNKGYDIWMLSGDQSEKVRRMAEKLALPFHKTMAENSPQEKAQWIKTHNPQETLMIGDGVNDKLASFESLCSGTPSIARPLLASQSDFYFIHPGLSPIRMALHMSKRLRKVIRIDFAIAIAYNFLAVSIAMVGWMKPWLAAVLMPTSSLFTIAVTTFSLSQRRNPWKS